MDRRKVGRALVLLGVALLLVRSVLCCAWIERPALKEVLADVLQRGPEGALSGEVGYLKTYQLLGNVLIGVYLLCAAVLASLLLRGAGCAHWVPSRHTSSASPSTSFVGEAIRMLTPSSWPWGLPRPSRGPRSWQGGAREAAARRCATGGPLATSRRWASRSSRGSTSTPPAAW